jgi:putative Ca2+/H+ antiporter (TMEM165/GDT1 family)
MFYDSFREVSDWWFALSAHSPGVDWATATMTTFALITAAEIGDKSQLVCMTLATRHRAAPIFLGATCAFALLNLAAVLFGAVLVQWIPRPWTAGLVALLFAGFGVKTLVTCPEGLDEPIREKPGHGIFATTFLMIVFAEFGDKTQLAVAGLSSSIAPAPVWLGATVALALVSGLGIWAGRTVLQKLPLMWLHHVSGLLFLVMAGYAGYEALPTQWRDALSWILCG